MVNFFKEQANSAFQSKRCQPDFFFYHPPTLAVPLEPFFVDLFLAKFHFIIKKTKGRLYLHIANINSVEEEWASRIIFHSALCPQTPQLMRLNCFLAEPNFTDLKNGNFI